MGTIAMLRSQQFATLRTRGVLSIMTMGWIAQFSFSYEHVESQIYAYTGLVYDPPGLAYSLLGAVIALVPLLWLQASVDRPSAVVSWWLYVTVVIPSAFVPFHVLSSPPGEVVILPLMMISALGILEWSVRFRRITLHSHRGNARTFRVVLLVVTIVGLGVIAGTHGFSLELPSDIYETRLAARDTLPAGSVLAYFSVIVRRSLVPLCLVVGLYQRSTALVLLGLVGAFLGFTLAAEKTMLAIPVLILSLKVLSLTGRMRSMPVLILTLTALMMVTASVEYLRFGTDTTSAYASRRLLNAPAQLTAYYWDYYRNEGPEYFRNGIIGRLLGLSNDNDLTPSERVGLVFFGTSAANANANVWASAFAEAGYMGVIAVSLLMGIVLRILDGALMDDLRIGISIAATIAIVWSDGAFQTSLLSQGVVVTLILIHILPVREPGKPKPLADVAPTPQLVRTTK